MSNALNPLALVYVVPEHVRHHVRDDRAAHGRLAPDEHGLRVGAVDAWEGQRDPGGVSPPTSCRRWLSSTTFVLCVDNVHRVLARLRVTLDIFGCLEI